MAVLRPLEVVIDNWPEGEVDRLDAINNPEDPSAGTREVPFSGRLWIERDDFMLDPPKKFYRLAPGREVRLRAGYFITCTDVETDDDGNVVRLHATYDPATRGGQAPDGRKVKATIHWVSAAHAVDATVVLYNRLFTDPHPGAGGEDPLASLNPDSREVLTGCKLEPVLADTPAGEVVQFERLGYFAHDLDTPLLFHRTVGLRDEWANIQKRQQKS
jgi:glutaminyl-tRNA synthetase